jgi:hypothetical protein
METKGILIFWIFLVVYFGGYILFPENKVYRLIIDWVAKIFNIEKEANNE